MTIYIEGGTSMTNEIQKTGVLDLIKVTLKCGRDMASEAGSAPDMCGSCEDSTSNQTQATCCY